MKLNRIFNFGRFAALFVIIALTVGCSSESPISPVSTNNFGTNDFVNNFTKDQPRNASGYDFKIYGQIVKLDSEKPFVVLSAKMPSDRTEQASEYVMDISKNATIVLLRDRTEVAFDSKLIPVGTDVTVVGVTLPDGTMIVDRFDLWQEDPGFVSSSAGR